MQGLLGRDALVVVRLPGCPTSYYRGTSTVWKWTCQGTELTNKDGCLQCETYSPAWGAVSPILAGIAMSPTGDVCMAVPNPFDWTQQ